MRHTRANVVSILFELQVRGSKDNYNSPVSIVGEFTWRARGTLESRLIMERTGVTIWFIGVTCILPKFP